jgi:hypothetical protein
MHGRHGDRMAEPEAGSTREVVAGVAGVAVCSLQVRQVQRTPGISQGNHRIRRISFPESWAYRRTGTAAPAVAGPPGRERLPGAGQGLGPVLVRLRVQGPGTEQPVLAPLRILSRIRHRISHREQACCRRSDRSAVLRVQLQEGHWQMAILRAVRPRSSGRISAWSRHFFHIPGRMA